MHEKDAEVCEELLAAVGALSGTSAANRAAFLQVNGSP